MSEEEDYADVKLKARRRWAPLEIAILILIIGGSIPILAMAAFILMWIATKDPNAR